MGLYNVVEPCIAGNTQFVRATPEFQPVEIDDADAAPGVEDGSLTPYAPGGIEGETATVLDGVIREVPETDGTVTGDIISEPKAKARSRLKADEG